MSVAARKVAALECEHAVSTLSMSFESALATLRTNLRHCGKFAQ